MYFAPEFCDAALALTRGQKSTRSLSINAQEVPETWQVMDPETFSTFDGLDVPNNISCEVTPCPDRWRTTETSNALWLAHVCIKIAPFKPVEVLAKQRVVVPILELAVAPDATLYQHITYTNLRREPRVIKPQFQHAEALYRRPLAEKLRDRQFDVQQAELYERAMGLRTYNGFVVSELTHVLRRGLQLRQAVPYPRYQ